jgi:outer membrane protein assembly factor BamD
MRRALLVLTLLAIVAQAGCGAKKKLPADEYFSKGNEEFEGGAYPLAIEYYRDLLDQYPFSEHGEEAELRIALSHYLGGDNAEAIAAFTDFQRRHPTSPHLALVGYVLGLCHMRQMVSEDRDQSASLSAHNHFVTVAQQYPESPFAELARERVAECRRSLAAHELYIAGFYAKRDNHKAAEMRLLNLLGRYEDTEVAPTALNDLAAVYRATENSERALLADAALTQHFPQSELSRNAIRRLERNPDAGTVVGGDPLSVLLAGITRGSRDGLSLPVEVPGLDDDDSPPLVPPGINTLAPPNSRPGSGAY